MLTCLFHVCDYESGWCRKWPFSFERTGSFQLDELDVLLAPCEDVAGACETTAFDRRGSPRWNYRFYPERERRCLLEACEPDPEAVCRC